MVRARVELRGALSHTRGGVVFKKGQPQTITDPGAIAYYKATSGFSVTMLEEEAPPRVKAPTAGSDKAESSSAGENAKRGSKK